MFNEMPDTILESFDSMLFNQKKNLNDARVHIRSELVFFHLTITFRTTIFQIFCPLSYHIMDFFILAVLTIIEKNFHVFP